MPESENDELHNGKARTSTLELDLDIIQIQQHLIREIINSSIFVVRQFAV
jgi:hypothetical protein